MWIITKNAWKERIRRKELYIVVAIAILILLMCSSGSATITIEGEPITSFENMFMVIHTLMNAVGCILAVILSIGTIPKEYERKNSHLIWVRGITQQTYHAGLTLANILSGVFAMLILYLALAVYIIVNGQWDYLFRMLPAFLIVSINVALTSLFVSVLTIPLPTMAAGAMGIIFAAVGILHSILNIYKNIAGGIAGTLLNGILHIFPDMHGIQRQAQNIMAQKTADIHLILVGILTLYIISLGLFIFKRKEA